MDTPAINYNYSDPCIEEIKLIEPKIITLADIEKEL